jgi:cation:H+ antiporter
MIEWTATLLFATAAIALFVCGDWLVQSLLVLARFLRIRQFVLSFILMAFATSIPELFVNITSGIANKGSIGLGNAIGASILDITFILGITLLLARKIDVKQKILKQSARSMTLVAPLPAILLAIGNEISRIDGAILIIVFLIYSYYLLKSGRDYRDLEHDHINRLTVILMTLAFLVALAGLFFASHVAVKTGTIMAAALRIPPLLLGLFILSFGTTLPELIFETRAVFRKTPSLALGDVMGSVICNSTLVIGINALINPIQANFLLFITGAIFLFFTSLLYYTFITRTTQLTWREGIIFLFVYIIFVLVELTVRGLIPSAQLL